MGLRIDYRFSTVEAAAAAGETFDVVLNMEVVEHVADANVFLRASGDLVASGGCMFVATLNRTVRSFAFAIVGAEYVMRWLPRGTHDWRKFLRPSEITANLRQGGLTVNSFTGLSFDPLRDRWRVSSDLSINYMGYAPRAESTALKRPSAANRVAGRHQYFPLQVPLPLRHSPGHECHVL